MSAGCAVTKQPAPLSIPVGPPPPAVTTVEYQYQPQINSPATPTLLFDDPPQTFDSNDVPSPMASFAAARVKPKLFDQIISDHQQFYSQRSLTHLGFGLGVGAVFANTKLDQEIQNKFQSGIRGATSDDWFEYLHAGKELGNGMYTLPVYGTAWAIGELFPESPVAATAGEWGARTTRSFLVGAPPVIALQAVVGGSRPGESPTGSWWTPFEDNNGVSGHAFMGSLPFITAAKMSNTPIAKTLFYTASTVVPISRVNDNAHYTSQAGLGWFVAYLAATAIDNTELANSRWQIYPGLPSGASGVTLETQY